MRSVSPKYQQVFNNLRRDIVSGRYGPGDRLPSEVELVKRFGSSRITVGRAVRDLREEGLVERRAGSGTFVRKLPFGREHGLSFGLLIPNLGQTEIFEPICQGMAEGAGGHSLIWGRSAGDSASLEDESLNLCRQYIERRVSGVFFAPLEHTPRHAEVNLLIISELSAARMPTVLLDRRVFPYPQRSDLDLVGIDNRGAGYLITEHLLKLGCRRILFWTSPLSATTVDTRIAGYHDAMAAYGAATEPQLVQRADPDDVGLVQSAMHSTSPDGIICANDRTAGILMHRLIGLGYSIPRDVRFCGIDDVHYASLLPVPLTTIHQPCRDIGNAAVSVMRDRLAHPRMAARDVYLSCHLVVRESCGSRLDSQLSATPRYA
jgi:GntR family transcriptional regulator of arabinose operon